MFFILPMPPWSLVFTVQHCGYSVGNMIGVAFPFLLPSGLKRRSCSAFPAYQIFAHKTSRLRTCFHPLCCRD